MMHEEKGATALEVRSEVCYIVGALPLEDGLLPAPRTGDLLIAADGGYQRLEEWGIRPHMVVGDFDSAPVPKDRDRVVRLPRIKDETDVGFALNEGLQRGYRRFLVLGGLGGALDHTLANLQLMAGLAARGGFALLAGCGQCAAVLGPGTLRFPAQPPGRISVFSAGDRVEGVTLDGLKYPLDRAELTKDFPLGVSNEFLGLDASVTVEAGMAYLIWDHDGGLDPLTALLHTAPIPTEEEGDTHGR